jgi:hypothetical protein
MAELKSLAHPEGPYEGTAHEWRGFVKAIEDDARKQAYEALKDYKGVLGSLTAEQHKAITEAEEAYTGSVLCGVYQKQNFGPELK